MMGALGSLFGIWRREDGVAAIEFCLTMPVLLLFTLGVYDVSQLVAKRLDYQQAVAEVTGLVIAQPPRSDFSQYIDVAAAAAAVPRSAVSITREVRCNNVVITGIMCPSSAEERAIYITIAVSGSYVPAWTHFGIDGALPIRISRTVRV